MFNVPKLILFRDLVPITLFFVTETGGYLSSYQY